MKTNLLVIIIILTLANDNVSSQNKIIAASCNREDVQAAIDQAEDGDTVLIPPGECTWVTPENEPAILIHQKSITLMGSGTDSTIITDRTGTSWGDCAIRVNGIIGKPFRISSLRLQNEGGSGIRILGTAMDWHIDDCEFYSEGFWTVIRIDGYTYGLVSNCTFYNGRILPFEGNGHESWKRPLSLGGAEAIYVESCDFIQNVFNNAIDANHGARYVFRYNRVVNGYCEVHSLQNAWAYDSTFARSTRSFEIYHNSFEAIDNNPTHANWVAVFLRGGTGVVFNNSIKNLGGPAFSQFGVVDNVRSFSERAYPLLLCDGTNPIDGNQEENGYPCLDQIGRSTDTGPDDQYHPQMLDPLYSWNNTLDDQLRGLNVHNNCDHHIQEGRDFFNLTPRPKYIPFPFPHPVSQSNAINKQLTLNLRDNTNGNIVELEWTAVDNAQNYLIVKDWNQDSTVNTTANSISLFTSIEGSVFMVYAIGIDDKIIAAEGKLVSESSDESTTGIVSSSSGSNKNLSLLQNYPNPFTTSTTITFQANQTGYYTLRIYDTMGRLIRTVADGTFPVGNHSLVWDGTCAVGRPNGNGVYFYQLQGEGMAITKRMIITGQ